MNVTKRDDKSGVIKDDGIGDFKIPECKMNRRRSKEPNAPYASPSFFAVFVQTTVLLRQAFELCFVFFGLVCSDLYHNMKETSCHILLAEYFC